MEIKSLLYIITCCSPTSLSWARQFYKFFPWICIYLYLYSFINVVLTITINSTCCANRISCSKFNSASCPCFHFQALLPWTKRNKLVFFKLFQWQLNSCALNSTQKATGLIPSNTSRQLPHTILFAQQWKQKARWIACLSAESLNADLPASLHCFQRDGGVARKRSSATLAKGLFPHFKTYHFPEKF